MEDGREEERDEKGKRGGCTMTLSVTVCPYPFPLSSCFGIIIYVGLQIDLSTSWMCIGRALMDNRLLGLTRNITATIMQEFSKVHL